MIDPTTENLISIPAVARLMARDGRAFSTVTIWRWIVEGRGPAKAKLETIKIGGRTCTSREALHRFLAALNGVRGEVSHE
jgi:hypothetical protein